MADEIKDIYTVVEREDDPDNPAWVHIGTAFVNDDGSLSCVLDALPINGRMEIVEAEEE